MSSITRNSATGRYSVSAKGKGSSKLASNFATSMPPPKGKPSKASKEAASSNASRHREALIRLADR